MREKRRWRPVLSAGAASQGFAYRLPTAYELILELQLELELSPCGRDVIPGMVSRFNGSKSATTD